MTRTDSAVRPDAGRALAWSLLNTAVSKFGTIAIGIALARLLGPAEFGTFAVATVALLAVLSFNELGVSLAIVRWERDPAEIAPTVTTISTAMSVLLAGLMVLLAPSFTAAMRAPDATLPVQLLALSVVINGVVATPAALMQRAFRQDQRMVADQVHVWLGATVSLGMAVLGFGAMSLVAGSLVGGIVSGALLIRFSPQPLRFGLDPTLVRQLLAFGLPLAGASIIVFFVSFVDQLIVGRMLGPVQLGYYVLAVNLASWPLALFSKPLRSVAPALFSRLQHDPAALSASFGRVLRPVAAVGVPLCALIAVAAPEIVTFVYGGAWDGVGPVLRWLAVLAAAKLFFELSYDYLVVRGRSSALLRIQLVWLSVLVPAVWFGATVGGIEGAALSLLVVSLAVSLPMYVAELTRVDVRAASVVRALVTPVAGAVLTALAVTLVLHEVPAGFVALVLSGVVAAGVTAAVVWSIRGDLTVFRTGSA